MIKIVIILKFALTKVLVSGDRVNICGIVKTCRDSLFN